MAYVQGAKTSPENGGDSAGTFLRNRSSHGGTMASSVIKFQDINFVVGKGDKQRNILENVSGKVKWGHVLAIMGPSGAGKTTLINALTLDAFYGKPSGLVTLNGVPLTDTIFKRHCFVVQQQDKHWPYLTTRETLQYAAELYDVADKRFIASVVSDMISKMGLDSCADTRAARLSGGQKRRLSLAIALLKQPTLLFLDEPTSGLDAAAASNIMREITRVAQEERIIIVCTIHQPSTKVYNGFDQVMIMSKGREAFAGNVEDAAPYFKSIGYPVPVATNPAEHFLDLVNSDFSSAEEVDKILDTWEGHKPDAVGGSWHGPTVDEDSDTTHGVQAVARRSFWHEVVIMFRRHSLLVIRDPVLYLGRCFVFLFTNLIFAFVYWNARGDSQNQATNKLWISIWFVGVPTQLGVVAVYSLNDEFKSLLRETKNGMVTSLSYILAKTVLVIPMMFVFAVFALGVPAYAVQAVPIESVASGIILWAALMYSFECAAEACAVLFDNPILGMMQFMNFWFGSFLFGGFLISVDDLYWPFKLFHYIFPYAYFIRSFIYSSFTEQTWEACSNPSLNGAVCVDSTNGIDVLEGLSRIFPVIEPKDKVWQDVGILLAISVFFKLVSAATIVYKTSKVASINSSAVARQSLSRTKPMGPKKVEIPVAAPESKVVDMFDQDLSDDDISEFEREA